MAPVSPGEATDFAREARATAEAAEQAAREASQRASDVADRLEQMGSGRHLMQELSQLQAEAEQASALAEEKDVPRCERRRLSRSRRRCVLNLLKLSQRWTIGKAYHPEVEEEQEQPPLDAEESQQVSI